MAMFPLYLYRQGALLAKYGGAIVVPPAGWSPPPADLHHKSAFRPRQQMFPQPALFRPLPSTVATATARATVGVTSMAANAGAADAGVVTAAGTTVAAAMGSASTSAAAAPRPSRVGGEGDEVGEASVAMTVKPATSEGVATVTRRERNIPVSSTGGVTPAPVIGALVAASTEAVLSPVKRPAPVQTEMPVDVGGSGDPELSRPASVAPLLPRSPVARPLATAPRPQSVDRNGKSAANGTAQTVEDRRPDKVADGGNVTADASEADESEEEMPLDRFERFQASLQRNASGQLVVCPTDAMDTAHDGGDSRPSAVAAAASLASPGTCDAAERCPSPDASCSGSPVEVRRSSAPVRRKRRLPSLALNGCSSSDDAVEPSALALELAAIRHVSATAPADVAVDIAADGTAAKDVVAAGVVAANVAAKDDDANDGDTEHTDRDDGESVVDPASMVEALPIGGVAAPAMEASGDIPYPFGLPRPILVRTKAGTILKPSNAPFCLPYCDVKYGRIRPGVPLQVSAVLSMARLGLRLDGGKVVSMTAPVTPVIDPVVVATPAGRRVATRAATRATTGGRRRASLEPVPQGAPTAAPPAALLAVSTAGTPVVSTPGASLTAREASRTAPFVTAAASMSAARAATAARAPGQLPKQAARERCALKVSRAAKVTKPGAQVVPLTIAIKAVAGASMSAPRSPPAPPSAQVVAVPPSVTVGPDTGNDGSAEPPLLPSAPALPSPSPRSPPSSPLPPPTSQRSSHRKRSVAASPASSAGALTLATPDGGVGGSRRRTSAGTTVKRPRVAAVPAPLSADRRSRSQSASRPSAPAAPTRLPAPRTAHTRRRERAFKAQMAAAKIPSFEISASSVTLDRFERRVLASAAQLRRRLPPDADLEEWFWDLLHGGAPLVPPHPIVRGGGGSRPPPAEARASALALGGAHQASYYGPGLGADPLAPPPSRERSYVALYGVDVEVNPIRRRRAPPPCVPAAEATARAKAAALEARSRFSAFSDSDMEPEVSPAEAVSGERSFQDVWSDLSSPPGPDGAAGGGGGGTAVTVRRSWHAGNINVGSALRHTAVMPGISSSMFYVGSLYSRFCWHVEDSLLNSLSFLHSGEPKIWYVIPPHQRRQLEAALADVLVPQVLKQDGDSAAAVLRHKTIMADVRWVASQAGVDVRRAEHRPGTFVALAPGAYHSGFNMGVNKAEAVNFAAPDWFRVGVESAEEARGSQVSFAFPVECVIIAEAESLAYGAGSPGTLSQMRAAAGADRFAADVGFIGDTVAAIAREVHDFLSPPPPPPSSPTAATMALGAAAPPPFHPTVVPGRVLLAEAPRKVVDFLATAGIPGGRACDGAVCHTCGYVAWAAVVVCAGCIDTLADEVCGVRCLRCAADVCAAGARAAGGGGEEGGAGAGAAGEAVPTAAAIAAVAAIGRDAPGRRGGDRSSSDGESETLGEGDASLPTPAAQAGETVASPGEGDAAAASAAMLVDSSPCGRRNDDGGSGGGGCDDSGGGDTMNGPGTPGAVCGARAAPGGGIPFRPSPSDAESDDCEVLFEGDADCPDRSTAMDGAASPPMLLPPMQPPRRPAGSPPVQSVSPVEPSAAGGAGGSGSGDESETLCEGRVSLPPGGSGGRGSGGSGGGSGSSGRDGSGRGSDRSGGDGGSDGGCGGGGATPSPPASRPDRPPPPPGGIRRPKAVPHAPLVVLREPVEWLTHIAAAVRTVAAGGPSQAGVTGGGGHGRTRASDVEEAASPLGAAGGGLRNLAAAASAAAAGAAAVPPVAAVAGGVLLGGGGVPASGPTAPARSFTPQASPTARVGQ